MGARRIASWTDREPGFAASFVELRRLLRRGAGHPIIVLLVVVAASVGLGVRTARKAPTYGSWVGLRVTEGDLDPTTAPQPMSQLRSWILEVALNTGALAGLAKKRGLYKSDWDQGDAAVANFFREDMDVDVWRNYFLFDRQEGDAARTARVTVGYHDGDPEVAHEVAQDIAQLVIDAQQAHRKQLADAAVREAERAADRVREEVNLRRAEMARLVALDDRSPAGRIAFDRAKRSLEQYEGRLRAIEGERASFELRRDIERRDLGMRFEIVDRGRPASPGSPATVRFAIVATVVFVVLLPLVTLAAGAFDSRIYRADDVSRLGLTILGHVGESPGIHRSSLRERTAALKEGRRRSTRRVE